MARYYVAHRLFAAHDRALGAFVAARLAKRVGAEQVFLPFCDTDEENLTDPCKGRRLFELDRERLRRIEGMIAIIHGPSLDDGVCMEIGFAAALGTPVVALTTDFQTYGPVPGAPELVFPDRLLNLALAEIVRVPRLAEPLADQGGRFTAFMHRNLRAVCTAADHAVSQLLSAHPPPRPAIAPSKAVGRRAFIEPSPYLRGRPMPGVAKLLAAYGWTVQHARRVHQPDDSAAQADWADALAADLVIADTAGPETPPGAALMIGARSAAGRDVIAADPGTCWTFADGREPNWRNLMIQYAVTGRFATLTELAALLNR